MNETIVAKWFWTTQAIGIITFSIFGFKALVSFIILYFLFVVVDFITGIQASRIQHTVSSSIGIHGARKKLNILLFILLISIISFTFSSLFELQGVAQMIIGLIPHGITLIFVLLEFISILENLSVIFGNKKEGVVFQVLIFLSNKLFDLTLEKLKTQIEKKIDNKFKE